MAVEIKLTRGYTAIVDDCDADLAEMKWTAQVSKAGNVYAHRRPQDENGKMLKIYLHRVVMERVLGRALSTSEHVDHEHGNGLICTRSELRLCTSTENSRNRRFTATGAAGLKGVGRDKRNPHFSWIAQISVNKKYNRLGSFRTPIEAHARYCLAAIELHGEFANFGSNSPFTGWTLIDFKRGYKQLELPFPVAS